MANCLTVFRLLLIPFFLVLLLNGASWAERASVVVFALAALTDLVDGYVARHFGRVTDFGKFVDPLADRLLIVAAVVGLYVKGVIPALAFASLAGRDAVLLAGFQLAKSLKKPLVKISQFGRVTNFYLMSAIVALLVYLAWWPLSLFMWAFYLGVVLYLISGLVYIIQEVRLLISDG